METKLTLKVTEAWDPWVLWPILSLFPWSGAHKTHVWAQKGETPPRFAEGGLFLGSQKYVVVPSLSLLQFLDIWTM